jgi:hypothetical protein
MVRSEEGIRLIKTNEVKSLIFSAVHKHEIETFIFFEINWKIAQFLGNKLKVHVTVKHSLILSHTSI